MQYSLFIFYLLNYFIIFLQLLLFTIIYMPLLAYVKTSMLIYINYWIQYTQNYLVICLLILSLAGLPPVFLFFVKINILGSIFFKFNWINDIFIFSIFFFNILYYLQLFRYKATFLSLFNVLKFDNLNVLLRFIYWYPTTKYATNFFFYLLQKNTKFHYNNLFVCLFFNLILLFSYLFFIDFYLLVNSCV